MKVLLLTDIPPCKNFTAGLVIWQLMKFLPKGSVSCYAVVHPLVNATLDPDFKDIPFIHKVKPREQSLRLLPWRFGFISAFLHEMYMHFVKVPRIANEVVNFAKKNGVDRIWCIMEGQTMFRLAVLVKKRLNLPLYTEVWDPPGWWLRANRVDYLSRKVIMNTFDKAMRLSRANAAASWAMSDYYNEKYRCNAIPVIPSLDKSWILKPAEKLHDRDTVIIGMAGQLYAEAEWINLLLTLERVNWTIAGKKIMIRLMGRQIEAHANTPHRIEFLGWQSQPDTLKLLSESDILYCPYWSDPVFVEEAKYSFPSKLTTFLAAGRPVFFHGPEYASPARFLKKYDAAVFSHDCSTVNIYNALEALIKDTALYARLAANGTKAISENLTLEVMRSQFEKFLEFKGNDQDNENHQDTEKDSNTNKGIEKNRHDQKILTPEINV